MKFKSSATTGASIRRVLVTFSTPSKVPGAPYGSKVNSRSPPLALRNKPAASNTAPAFLERSKIRDRPCFGVICPAIDAAPLTRPLNAPSKPFPAPNLALKLWTVIPREIFNRLKDTSIGPLRPLMAPRLGRLRISSTPPLTIIFGPCPTPRPIRLTGASSQLPILRVLKSALSNFPCGVKPTAATPCKPGASNCISLRTIGLDSVAENLSTPDLAAALRQPICAICKLIPVKSELNCSSGKAPFGKATRTSARPEPVMKPGGTAIVKFSSSAGDNSTDARTYAPVLPLGPKGICQLPSNGTVSSSPDPDRRSPFGSAKKSTLSALRTWPRINAALLNLIISPMASYLTCLGGNFFLRIKLNRAETCACPCMVWVRSLDLEINRNGGSSSMLKAALRLLLAIRSTCAGAGLIRVSGITNVVPEVSIMPPCAALTQPDSTPATKRVSVRVT